MEKEKQNKIQKEVSYENEKKEWFSDRTGKIILGISVGILIVLMIIMGLFLYNFIVVVPTIQPRMGSPCLNAGSQIGIKESEFTCKSQKNNLTQFQIARGSGEFELSGINIALSKDGSTYFYNISNTNNEVFSSINLTTIATYETLPNPNEDRVFFIKGMADEISIAPSVFVGPTIMQCEISSTKILRYCDE